MNDLFDENNSNLEDLANTESDSGSESLSLSLDDRQTQLEDKINREMNADNEPKNNVSSDNKNDDVSETEFRSPYDRAAPQKQPQTEFFTPLPKMNQTVTQQGSSLTPPSFPPYSQHNAQFNSQPNFNNKSQPMPYANTNVTDYTNGSAAYAPPQKRKIPMNGSLKAYLIVVFGITAIFLGAFIFECVQTYSNNGVFGGEHGFLNDDLDKYLDSDYDFGFKFKNSDKDKNKNSNDTDNTDSDKDNSFGYVDKNGSDADTKELKKAPDKNTVINREAAVIKAANQPEDIDSAEYTARKAFKRVENSVVNVVVYAGEIGDETAADGTGSGIIISSDGYIVTNSHVISDSNQLNVEIITTNGNTYAAAIVGYDSRTDLAVLKIDAENLQAVEFVNSDQVEVGQDAIAVGNPGGVKYSNSLTKGCVSALNRTVSSNRMVSYIQTDAAINPGNSGGPLLNSAGQVMGINTIKIASSNYEGMGFAIPSNTVISIANDLIGQGFVSGRVRIGVTGKEYAEDYLGTIPSGIMIAEFSDDSPFNNTEAKVGDIITAINGKEITNFTQLFSEMENYNPGDEITVSLFRPAGSGSKSKEFDVRIKLLEDNGETQQK